MNEITLENIQWFNKILRSYDGLDFKSELYFEENFPVKVQTNEFKGKIVFKNLFIGDYLQTNITDEYILNFASAKHPGGGILFGSIAQEEDICRNSLLYLSLVKFNQSHYLAEKFKHSIFYEDFIIFSPNIPTIKRDLSMGPSNHYITCAAPNLNNLPNIDTELLQQTLIKRIRGIFILLNEKKCKKLVLGPWGCGVFKNDPEQIATIFDIVIKMLGGELEQITFLIPDKKMMEIFKKKLQ